MGDDFEVRTSDPRAASPSMIEAWADLEDRALEPNAYLSPSFVLPALRFIDPDARPTAFEVWRGDRLVALLLATPEAGAKAFPLPHLVAYRSKHSYLSGLLLDAELAEPALDALLGHVRAAAPRWHGVRFQRTWVDGPQYELLSRRASGDAVWETCRRAVLRPSLDRARLEAALAHQTSSLAKRIKKLGDEGRTVTWSVVAGGAALGPAIETFLDLEHGGWKAEEGTSLRATAAGQSFFRAVASGLGERGRAIFVELAVDGQPIASSSNFLSKGAGFAFKIGWREEHSKVSPGIQVELHLLRQTYEHPALRDLALWDSGAEEGSYMDRLWPSRRVVAWHALATTRLGASVLAMVDTARTIRREKKAIERASRPPPRNDDQSG